MPIEFIATAKLPTPWAVFDMHGFYDTEHDKEHLAISLGDITGETPVLARIHSECLTGDALFSLRCDCGFQLETALQRIAQEGRGVLLYLQQEGRGIGLMNKIKAYQLQDNGMDTVEANNELGFEADQREYSMCPIMLQHLGVSSLLLMTNNPRKVKAMESFGINVFDRLPLEVGQNPHNAYYLKTKAGKLGHFLMHQDEDFDS